MHYKIKELHKLITTLKNEEGLSDYGTLLLEGYATGLQTVVKENCNLQNVNVRYCWLRPDGEYSEHKYRNLDEIDDFEKDEANDNGWKLIRLEEVDF